MDNIVTGASNDPRQEAQEGRPNIPQGTQTGVGESPGAVVGSDMGNLIGDLPLQAQSQEMSGQQIPMQPGGTTGVGFNSHVPAVGLGVAPWLTDNPRTQMLLPDIPNYQEHMRNMPVEDRSPQLLDMNTPSPFRTQLPPQVGNETLQRISDQFAGAIRQRNALELHSRLRQFVDYQPWKYADTESEPSSVSTSIPSSTSTVTDRLFSPFGFGGRGRSGDVISNNPVVTNLADQVGAAVRTLGGLGQDAFELVTGNKDGRLFNNTVREGTRFIEEIQGVPTGDGQYSFNPLRGEFGELGRGWVGAINYATNLPEQLAWASVYSVLDLGQAINSAMPSLEEFIDGAPPLDMTQVDVPAEYNQPFYRYGQAFTGVDLDLVNFRDGSGNRYLAMIPNEAPLAEQITWGGIGFLGSLAFGSVVDNGLQLLQRRTPMVLDNLRRGSSVPDALRDAARLDEAQALRRAHRPVPTFEPVEETSLGRQLDSLPEAEFIDYDKLIREAAERGDNNEAARLVRESASRVSGSLQPPPGNIPIVNISPTEMAQALNRVPQGSVPIPNLRARTNNELSYVARQLGILREPHTLSNEQLDVLNQLFPETFNRFGAPVNVGDDITQAIRNAPTPEEAAKIVRRSAQLIQEQNSELRRVFQEGGEVPESVFRRAQQIANLPPTEKVSMWGEEVPSYLRNVDAADARKVLRAEDTAISASHGMQELEGEIDTLRFEILKQGARLDGDLGKFVRGNVADEIQTWAQHGRIVPGTQVQELLPSEVPNLSGTIGGSWYHGTRQADIFGVNYHHGTPHEYGTGLYLTDSPDYARIAAHSTRTPNNPIPGTTRLLEGGMVNKVNAEIRKPLDVTAEFSEDIRTVFERAVNDISGSAEVTKEYKRLMRSRGTDQAWLAFREAYANVTNARLPELMYRGFSTQVSNGIRMAGYDSILDSRRGVLVAIPDVDGRVRGVAVPVEGVAPASKLQATYARHWMDANTHAVLKNSSTEAAELQSRMALENAAMEQLLEQYNRNAPEALRAVRELSASERQVIQSARAMSEAELSEKLQTAPKAALETPEFKKYMNTPLDEACL